MLVPSLYDENIFFAFLENKEHKILIENGMLFYEDAIHDKDLKEFEKKYRIKQSIGLGSIDEYLKGSEKLEDKKNRFYSKYFGVTWDITLEKWKAYYSDKHRYVHLGYYTQEIKANFAVQDYIKKNYKKL
jgi:hypothetical protein